MKGTIIGVARMSGIGQESKKKYDMAKAYVMATIQPFENENTKRIGTGFEVTEVDIGIGSWAFFEKQTYPLQCEMVLESVSRNGRMGVVLVGVQQKAA